MQHQPTEVVTVFALYMLKPGDRTRSSRKSSLTPLADDSSISFRPSLSKNLLTDFSHYRWSWHTPARSCSYQVHTLLSYLPGIHPMNSTLINSPHLARKRGPYFDRKMMAAGMRRLHSALKSILFLSSCNNLESNPPPSASMQIIPFLSFCFCVRRFLTYRPSFVV